MRESLKQFIRNFLCSVGQWSSNLGQGGDLTSVSLQSINQSQFPVYFFCFQVTRTCGVFTWLWALKWSFLLYSTFKADLIEQKMWGKSLQWALSSLPPSHLHKRNCLFFRCGHVRFRELMGYQRACRKPESGAGIRQGSDNPTRQLMGQCWAAGSQKVIWKNIANSSLPSIYTELSWSLWVKTPFFLACLQIDKVGENRINTWMFWIHPNLDL